MASSTIVSARRESPASNSSPVQSLASMPSSPVRIFHVELGSYVLYPAASCPVPKPRKCKSMKIVAVMAPQQSERKRATTGSGNVWVDVDISMTHDGCGPGSIGIFKKEFGQNVVSVMAPQQSERKPTTTGTVKTAMTMTEKILARASEKTHLNPGDNVWVDVDILMTHDVCGPGSIGIFKKEFGQNAKAWDREKIVIIPDHYIFTSDERANRNVDILRDFCEEQDIKYSSDIQDRGNFKANPDYKGVCHIALAQEGHCRPGEVLLGTDSHTCTAGAFGQFATGIGNTDAGFVMGAGKLLLKDKTSLPYEPVYSDQQARYLSEYRFDISKLEPIVAKVCVSTTNRSFPIECLAMLLVYTCAWPQLVREFGTDVPLSVLLYLAIYCQNFPGSLGHKL